MHSRSRRTHRTLHLESLERRRLLAVDLLAELNLDSGINFTPRDITEFKGGIIFRGSDGEIGPEAWVSDGTSASTQILKDIRVGPLGSGPRDFTFFNGRYYFGANNGFNGYELWVTDGTRASTQLVADIWPGSESGALSEITILGDQMYFFANDGESGRELYRSDGTALGTERILDAIPGFGSLDGEKLTIVGDRIFFVSVANSASNTQGGIWVTDGTAQGTLHLPMEGVNPDDVRFLTPFGNQLVFASGNRLWATDGTVAGSRVVDATTRNVNGIASTDGKLYVSSDIGLQSFDASLQNPTLLVGDSLGTTSSAGTAYHWNSSGLYSIDASDKITSLVGFVSFFGTKMGSTWNVPGGMAFHVNRTLNQHEIWVTDGTPTGTQQLETVTDDSPEPLAGFRQVEDGIYFAATNGLFRESLWRVEAPILEVPSDPTLPGDVNGDGLINAADIDAVFAGAKQNSNDKQLDLNSDDLVTTADGIFLVEEVLQTKPGDLDLNSKVDFADFLILSANFGSQVEGWSDGDLDGDGSVAFPDFLQLSANFGFAARTKVV